MSRIRSDIPVVRVHDPSATERPARSGDADRGVYP